MLTYLSILSALIPYISVFHHMWNIYDFQLFHSPKIHIDGDSWYINEDNRRDTVYNSPQDLKKYLLSYMEERISFFENVPREQSYFKEVRDTLLDL